MSSREHPKHDQAEALGPFTGASRREVVGVLSSLSVASAPLRVAGRPAEVWKVYSAHARVHSTVGERRCRVAAGHGGALARHAAAFVIVGPGAGILTPVGALPPGRSPWS